MSGPGRRITTDDGATREADGSGFQIAAGVPRGSRGVMRRGSWAGARWDSTIVPFSPGRFQSAIATVDGADGRSSRAITLAVIGPFDSSPSHRDRCPRTSDSSRNGRPRWRRRALCRDVDLTLEDSSQAIDVSFQTLLG